MEIKNSSQTSGGESAWSWGEEEDTKTGPNTTENQSEEVCNRKGISSKPALSSPRATPTIILCKAHFLNCVLSKFFPSLTLS